MLRWAKAALPFSDHITRKQSLLKSLLVADKTKLKPKFWVMNFKAITSFSNHYENSVHDFLNKFNFCMCSRINQSTITQYYQSKKNWVKFTLTELG